MFNKPSIVSSYNHHRCIQCAALLPSPFCFIRLASRWRAPTEDFEFFEKRIRPVLVSHCYPCHSTSAEKIKGGLKLDSRTDLLKGGENGPVIVPGNAEASRLIEAVRYRNPDLKMPPPKKGKLSEEQIADLVIWINSGGHVRHSFSTCRGCEKALGFSACRKSGVSRSAGKEMGQNAG